MPRCSEEFAETSCWTTEYWLWHCEGYRVYAPEGLVGFVEDVLGSGDRPTALVVRAGEVFTHCLTIPVDAIEGLDLAGERVFIGSLASSAPEARARQLRIPAAVQ